MLHKHLLVIWVVLKCTLLFGTLKCTIIMVIYLILTFLIFLFLSCFPFVILMLFIVYLLYDVCTVSSSQYWPQVPLPCKWNEILPASLFGLYTTLCAQTTLFTLYKMLHIYIYIAINLVHTIFSRFNFACLNYRCL